MASSFTYTGPQTKEEYYSSPRFARPDQTFGPAAPTGNPLVDMGIQPRFAPPAAPSQTGYTLEERAALIKREEGVLRKQAIKKSVDEFQDAALLPAAMKFVRKKKLEIAEKHPELWDNVNKTGVARMIADSVVETVNRNADFVLYPVDKLTSMAGLPTSNKIVNRVRQDDGEDPYADKDMDGLPDTPESPSFLKGFWNGMKDFFVGNAQRTYQLASMPEGPEKKAAWEAYSFGLLSDMAAAGTMGLTRNLEKKAGFTFEGDNIVFQGKPVAKMTPDEAKAMKAAGLPGKMIGSMAVYGRVSPALAKGIQGIHPVASAAYAKAPFLTNAIFTNAAEEAFEATVRKATGQEYTLLDTFNGLLMGGIFETGRFALGKMKPDIEAGRVVMEDAANRLTNNLKRAPEMSEIMNEVADVKYPGTDITFGDLHMTAARAFAENRLLGFKQEGRAGMEIPTEPPRFAKKASAETAPVDFGKKNKPDIENTITKFREMGSDVKQIEMPIGKINPVGKVRSEGVDAKPGDTLPPPVGFFNPKTGQVDLIDGNRRFSYFESKGYKSVPVTVIDPMHALPKSDLEGATPVRSEVAEARFAGLRGKKPIEGEIRPEPEDPRMEALIKKYGSKGNIPMSEFSPQGRSDAESASKLEAQGKTPEEAAHILSQIGDVQSRAGRLMTVGRKAVGALPRFGKKVDQTFRTDKFNIDEAGQTRLKQVQQSLGLMERDVRTWPEVEEMAKEIGQNPLELMKRVQGNRLLTDAEVEALRQTTQNASEFLSRKYDLIDEARTKGDMDSVRDIEQKADAYEKILDASVRKLIGGGTELGRGVAIYRKIAARKFDDPTYWYKEAAKLIEDQKTVRVFAGGKDTKVPVEEGKFPEPLRKAIDDLVSSKDQLGMAQLMAHLRQSGNIEKGVTLWKSGLLSAPTTHLANILGNTTMRALEEVKDIPATIIDTLLSPITKQRTKVFLSPAKFGAEVSGAGEGLKKGWEYMKTGVDIDDVMEKWDLPHETHFDNAILEGYTQSIFRSLGAEDMAFRYPALRRSIAEQAVVRVKNMVDADLKEAIENLPAEMPKTKDSLVRLFMKKPSDEMAKIAMEDADYASFHRETLLSTLAKGARQSARRRFGSTGTLPVEFVAPFVRTPSAVASTIVDYSPAGFIKESLTQLAKKGFDQKRFVEAAGRSSVGTAVIAIGAEMARHGLMTGNAPEDPAERKLWSEAGKQANSVFVFGKWRKLDRMSPMGNLLTIGAEWDELGREKPRAQQIAQTAAAGAKSLTQQTFLMGVSQAVETLSQPERNLENYVENSVRGLVPNVIAKVAQGADPLRRESDPWNFLHYFGNRIPILTKQLPAQQNVFGIPMKNQRGIAQSLLDPFSSQAPTEDPVIKELLRLNRPVSRPGKGEYSPQEYRRMMELRGKTLYPLLRAAVENPQWKDIGDDDKRKLIEDFSSDATRQVNAALKLGVANRLAQELSEVSSNDRMRRLEKIRERDNDLYWMIEAAALSQNSL